MRSLYLRIWITVVASLALFALVSGWLVQRHLGQERAHAEAVLSERVAAWGELMQRALPPADAPAALQAQALRAWSHRLRVPMALDDAAGRRTAAASRPICSHHSGNRASRAVRTSIRAAAPVPAVAKVWAC